MTTFAPHTAPAHLSQLRRTLGLTQADVAARLGVTQAVVARLESGRGAMQIDTLERWSHALGQRIELRLEPVPDIELRLGTAPGDGDVTITGTELSQHAVMLGAAPVADLVAQLADGGWGVTVIDLAGTAGALAASATAPLRTLDLSALSLTGSPTQIADAFIAHTADGYWQAVSTTLLTQLLELHRRSGGTTLADIGRALHALSRDGRIDTACSDPDRFPALLAPSDDQRHGAAALAEHFAELDRCGLGNTTLGGGARPRHSADQAITIVEVHGEHPALQLIVGAAFDDARAHSPRHCIVVSGADERLGNSYLRQLAGARAAGVAVITTTAGPSTLGELWQRVAQNANIVMTSALQHPDDTDAIAAVTGDPTAAAAVATLRRGELLLHVHSTHRSTRFHVNGADGEHHSRAPHPTVGDRLTVEVGSVTLEDRILTGIELADDGGRRWALRNADGTVEHYDEALITVVD
jgi:transcriptional regulator with XRE-family HTH domain